MVLSGKHYKREKDRERKYSEREREIEGQGEQRRRVESSKCMAFMWHICRCDISNNRHTCLYRHAYIKHMQYCQPQT